MSSNTAISDLLLMYLIDFTELQYSTMISALKMFVNKEQVLSKATSQPRKLMLAVNTQPLKTYDDLMDIRPPCLRFFWKKDCIALCKSILHAWRMWIYASAWTVHHLLCYNAKKIMVFLWITDFCTNKVIPSVNT
ncbi:hypothetical protein AVEN_268671-1 [Araneus ventricosus]|uniref:Uncharacterized protein n=1 Tax=Araneus ventricosus TaxID=182803 RepID=A0A4Y2Q3F8_ARAVE|nr:hypothetical protein AVEN_268671-1 [Araneus ventricosus]